MGLRISNAERLAPEHIQDELIKIEAGKMGIFCYIPFLDDEVLNALGAVVRRSGPCHLPADYLLSTSYLARLARLTSIPRLHVTSHALAA